MTKQISVGIGDMKLSRMEGTIITYALGSCIGIVLYDSAIKLAALVHIMLPEKLNMSDPNLFKYADSGLRETLRKMSAFGASPARVTAKIAGGAKMFEMKGSNGLGNIGERNSQMVKQILYEQKIRLVGEDIGLNFARTMSVDVSTGSVEIKTFGRPVKIL